MWDAHQECRAVLQALFIAAKVLPMASTTAAASTIKNSFMARFHCGIPDYPCSVGTYSGADELAMNMAFDLIGSASGKSAVDRCGAGST